MTSLSHLVSVLGPISAFQIRLSPRRAGSLSVVESFVHIGLQWAGSLGTVVILSLC